MEPEDEKKIHVRGEEGTKRIRRKEEDKENEKDWRKQIRKRKSRRRRNE